MLSKGNMEHWKKLAKKSQLSESELKQIPSDNIGNFQSILKIYLEKGWDVNLLLKDTGVTLEDFNDNSIWIDPRISETISRNFFIYAKEPLTHRYGYRIGLEHTSFKSVNNTIIKHTPIRTIIKNSYTTARKFENSFDYEINTPDPKTYSFKVTPKKFKKLALVGHESFVFEGFLNNLYRVKNIKIKNFKSHCRSSDLIGIINFFYKDKGFDVQGDKIYLDGDLFAEKKEIILIPGISSVMEDCLEHRVFVIVKDFVLRGVPVFLKGEVYNAPYCLFTWSLESSSLFLQRIRELFLFKKKKSLCELEELITQNNKRAKELLQMSAVLKEEQRNKEQFLANIVHEIKSPLANIVMLIDSLIDHIDCTPDFVKEGFALLGDKSTNLTNFVDNVMGYFSMDSNSFKLKKEKLDLAFLVNDVLDNFSHIADSSELYISSIITPDLYIVDGDYYRLVQVFLNIIGNSVKFTKEGSIKISAEFDKDRVLVSVEDTGVGIEADKLDGIFNIFEANLKGETINRQGIGLGLYIAKSIIEHHNGSIEVSSKVGTGTTFKIGLPYSAA